MSNHPNRSGRSYPTPDEIRKWRAAHGLTQREAAALIHGTVSAFENYEQNLRRLHPGLWELLQIKTGVINVTIRKRPAEHK